VTAPGAHLQPVSAAVRYNQGNAGMQLLLLHTSPMFAAAAVKDAAAVWIHLAGEACLAKRHTAIPMALQLTPHSHPHGPSINATQPSPWPFN